MSLFINVFLNVVQNPEMEFDDDFYLQFTSKKDFVNYAYKLIKGHIEEVNLLDLFDTYPLFALSHMAKKGILNISENELYLTEKELKDIKFIWFKEDKDNNHFCLYRVDKGINSNLLLHKIEKLLNRDGFIVQYTQDGEIL